MEVISKISKESTRRKISIGLGVKTKSVYYQPTQAYLCIISPLRLNRVLSAHLGLNRVLSAHLGSTVYYQPT